MPVRKLYRKIYSRYQKRKRLFFLLKFLTIISLFLALLILFLFIFYAKNLPRPENFAERQFILPTKIYDRTGEVLLYEIYGEEKRTIIPLELVSENLKWAVIVAEDVNFYKHFGLDLKGIFRAIFFNIKIGKPVQGASTIPQQLIRSTFLTLEKTAERKIREIILALELDRRYSKSQILEWYLNQVPFGSNAYGVESAAKTFFNKSASEVSVAEAALLASLIQAPSYLSPYGFHLDELFERKNYILDRMAGVAYLSPEEAEIAKKEELNFVKTLQLAIAPHFVLEVKDYLIEKYGEDFLKKQGLKVYTTLDWELQEIAEKAIKEGVEINKNYNAHNAGLVAIDPQTGEILAMVGSKDYFGESYPEGCKPGLDCLFEPNVNVTNYGGGRQPGSAFKPFAYASAFKKGLTTEAILWDVKTEFNPDCASSANQEKDEYGLDCYHPKNYDDKFKGPITFRQALAQSINVPSVKVLYLAGVQETIKLAKTLGITTLNQPSSWYGLSLVLGGGEVKLLDMVSAYGVFAAEGLKVLPVSILKIEDRQGNILEKNKKTSKRVLEVQISRLINDVLSDNTARAPMFGLQSSLYFKDYQIAVKTGTTQDYRDAWTIGYSPTIAAGVWVGNNDNSSTGEKPGLVLAAPIWHRFMEEALLKFPKKDFEKPESILVEKPVLKGEINQEDPHSILHYVEKSNPRAEMSQDPEEDPQYLNWEEGIKKWFNLNY